MEINIQDLLEKKAIAEEVIRREVINISRYNHFIINKINKDLEYEHYCLRAVVETVEKFSEYTKEYNLTNIKRIHSYEDSDITYSFTYKNNDYKIVIPLRYLDVKELTPYLLMDYNYCKIRLYKMEKDFVHTMIDFFVDVKSALNFLKSEY